MIVGMEAFRAVLEAKRDELAKALKQREEIHVEKAADPIDNVIAAASREVAVNGVNRTTEQLRQVQDALDRIKRGTFGICIACEEEMHLKRLNAVPWAARCIHCQEAEDRAEADPIEKDQAA